MILTPHGGKQQQQRWGWVVGRRQLRPRGQRRPTRTKPRRWWLLWPPRNLAPWRLQRDVRSVEDRPRVATAAEDNDADVTRWWLSQTWASHTSVGAVQPWWPRRVAMARVATAAEADIPPPERGPPRSRRWSPCRACTWRFSGRRCRSDRSSCARRRPASCWRPLDRCRASLVRQRRPRRVAVPRPGQVGCAVDGDGGGDGGDDGGDDDGTWGGESERSPVRAGLGRSPAASSPAAPVARSRFDSGCSARRTPGTLAPPAPTTGNIRFCRQVFPLRGISASSGI